MFNATEYWLDRGKTYAEEGLRLFSPYMEAQASFIAETVRDFRPDTILEIGCGFGRVTKVLAKGNPGAAITGFDLSPDQIVKAKEYCAGTQATFVCADLNRLPRFLPFDICVASEVFLHLREHDLRSLIAKVMAACPVLIHDFDIEWKDTASPHVYNHDYLEIYRELGLTAERRIKDEVGLMVVRRG